MDSGSISDTQRTMVLPLLQETNIRGKPYITVSAKGIVNGLSRYPNDGADFGPDTTKGATAPGQYGSPYTLTTGIQESINYLFPLGGGHIKLTGGAFVIDPSTPWLNTGYGNDANDAGGTTLYCLINLPSTLADTVTVYNIEGVNGMSSTGTTGFADWNASLSLGDTVIDAHLVSVPSGASGTDGYVIFGQVLPSGMSAGTPLNTSVIMRNMFFLKPSIDVGSVNIGGMNTALEYLSSFTYGMEDSQRPASPTVQSVDFTCSGYGANSAWANMLNSQGSYIAFVFGDGTAAGQLHANMCITILRAIVGSHTASIQHLGFNGCGSGILVDSGGVGAYLHISKYGGEDYGYEGNNAGDTTSPQPMSDVWFNGVGSSLALPTFIKIDVFDVAYDNAPNNPRAPNIAYMPASGAFIDIGTVDAVADLSTPSVPASGTAIQNTNPYAVDIYIYGGTVTEIQIKKNGASSATTVLSNSTGLALSGQLFTLKSLDSITLTYTTAPTWEWLVD